MRSVCVCVGSGSGKTYTMGTGNLLQTSEAGQDVGILPRVIRFVFDEVNSRRESSPGATFSLKVQFLELYGDDLRDLLSPAVSGDKPLSIREDERAGLQVVLLELLLLFWSGHTGCLQACKHTG
jgi:kinesin family protein 11